MPEASQASFLLAQIPNSRLTVLAHSAASSVVSPSASASGLGLTFSPMPIVLVRLVLIPLVAIGEPMNISRPRCRIVALLSSISSIGEADTAFKPLKALLYVEAPAHP